MTREDDIWLANIMRRTGKSSKEVVNKRDLERYKRTVKRVNASLAKQEAEILAGKPPLEREIERKRLGLGYRITDLSDKIRNQEELDRLLETVSIHSATKSNIRFRDNYKESLANSGFSQKLQDKIAKLSGKNFVKAYYQMTNASISFVYLTSQSESDGMQSRLEAQWEETLRTMNLW